MGSGTAETVHHGPGRPLFITGAPSRPLPDATQGARCYASNRSEGLRRLCGASRSQARVVGMENGRAGSPLERVWVLSV